MATDYIITDDPNAQKVTYIAGPMTLIGPPTWNYPAFEAMAHYLRACGWEVISPHELHPSDSETPYDWFMRRDLAELVKCGRVVMLNQWEKSRGAKLEFTVAVDLGMEIVYEHDINWLTRSEIEAMA